MEVSKSRERCVLGAALELTRHGASDSLVVDRNKTVGGLARTEVHGGARFDLGPHRFFTGSEEIDRIWHETLGSDFSPVSRLTRLFYKNKYFRYPAKPFDVLARLGPVESGNVISSFVTSQLRRKEKANTFEEWMVRKFGRRLYEIFFKTYQDHSIMSGILAARDYSRLPGSPYNLWDINIDPEHHETMKRGFG